MVITSGSSSAVFEGDAIWCIAAAETCLMLYPKNGGPPSKVIVADPPVLALAALIAFMEKSP